MSTIHRAIASTMIATVAFGGLGCDPDEPADDAETRCAEAIEYVGECLPSVELDPAACDPDAADALLELDCPELEALHAENKTDSYCRLMGWPCPPAPGKNPGK